jgi:hypothetical protein
MGGGGRENAKAARRRLRKDAAVVREDRLIELYARGETMTDIRDEMAREFGSCSLSHLYEMLPRALARRAEALSATTVEEARALYVARLELAARSWAPRAFGEAIDADTGVQLAPDPRIGDLWMKAVDRIAEVTGGRERPRRGEVHVNVFNLPEDPDGARARILAELMGEREKVLTVEGHLAGVGSSLHALTDREEPTDDRMPPPGGAQEEEQAA